MGMITEELREAVLWFLTQKHGSSDGIFPMLRDSDLLYSTSWYTAEWWGFDEEIYGEIIKIKDFARYEDFANYIDLEALLNDEDFMREFMSTYAGSGWKWMGGARI